VTLRWREGDSNRRSPAYDGARRIGSVRRDRRLMARSRRSSPTPYRAAGPVIARAIATRGQQAASNSRRFRLICVSDPQARSGFLVPPTVATIARRCSPSPIPHALRNAATRAGRAQPAHLTGRDRERGARLRSRTLQCERHRSVWRHICHLYGTVRFGFR
jgi:hypothetical protein